MILEFPILLKMGFQQNWTNHHDKIGNSINRAYIRWEVSITLYIYLDMYIWMHFPIHFHILMDMHISQKIIWDENEIEHTCQYEWDYWSLRWSFLIGFSLSVNYTTPPTLITHPEVLDPPSKGVIQRKIMSYKVWCQFPPSMSWSQDEIQR